MLASKVLGNTAYSARVRAMPRVGTLCGVFGVVLLSLGFTQIGPCPLFRPPPPPVTCSDTDPCNDDNACTTDTCVEGVCDFADCPDGQACDAGACKTPCDAASAAVDCGDGNACTDDSCGDDGFCGTSGATDCDDDDACTTDGCVAATGCTHANVDCDDGVDCTDDTCDAGVCANTDNCTAPRTCNATSGLCEGALACLTNADCNDSVACTDDTCDAGVCANADNCTAPETCNETTGLCEGATACTTDGDCTDVLFCNGADSCNTTSGFCTHSGNPCDTAAGETCNEGLNQCDVPPPPPAAAAVVLGTAGNYVILAKTGISTVPTSAVTGNVGLSPAARGGLTGWSETSDVTDTYSTSAQVVAPGKLYAADYVGGTTSVDLTTAVSNMETAYTDAAGRAAGVTELGAGNIGGLTLVPGVYKWGTGVTIPTDVTLSGGANDVWIFQIAQTLDLASAKNVILSGGALPKNIFWQVAGIVTIGTTAHFEGIILAQTKIDLLTGASINGRLLAQTAVNIQGSTVTQPAP